MQYTKEVLDALLVNKQLIIENCQLRFTLLQAHEAQAKNELALIQIELARLEIAAKNEADTPEVNPIDSE